MVIRKRKKNYTYSCLIDRFVPLQHDIRDFEAVKQALREGRLGNGRPLTDPEILELEVSGKLWTRYRQHIRRFTYDAGVCS